MNTNTHTWLAENGGLDGVIAEVNDAYDAIHDAMTLEAIRAAFDRLMRATSEASIEAAALARTTAPAPVQEQRGEQKQ